MSLIFAWQNVLPIARRKRSIIKRIDMTGPSTGTLGAGCMRVARPANGAAATATTVKSPTVIWDDLDVAVVGGGPAGLAAAAALLKADPGLKIKVFEASPAYRTQGAGVLLQYNGARALEAIHPPLLHRLAGCGTITSGMYQYNDETGERLPWVGGKDILGDLERCGWVNMLVLWSNIREALHAALPAGTVEFGCRVMLTDMEPEEDEKQEREQQQQLADGGGAGTSSAAGPYSTITIARRAPLRGGAGGGRCESEEGKPMAEGAEEAEGEEEEEEVVARARYVVAADGYFSRVRRTSTDQPTPPTRIHRMPTGVGCNEHHRPEVTSGLHDRPLLRDLAIP